MLMMNRTTTLFLLALATTASAVQQAADQAVTGLADQGRFASDVKPAVNGVSDRTDPKARDDGAQGSVSGDPCTSSTESCCEAHATPGCEDPACCNSLCAVPGLEYCCQTVWDAQCVANAFFYCGAKCETEVCADATGSCCEARATPGCEDSTCCDSVCAVDPVCCQGTWDGACATKAFDLCGDFCDREVCADATGSCCEAHATPGCEDPACCEAVCADPICCEVSWDGACATKAFELCGDFCEKQVCGDPNTTGSCCDAHLTRGCEDQTCCDKVCAADPVCCEGTWDGGCTTRAESLCGTVCTGACCEPNEPNGCRESTPFNCTTVNAFQGLGTECEPDQACCLGNGTCEDLAPVCCAAQGGTLLGASTSCTANCCDDHHCPPDPNKCFDSFCDLTDNICKEETLPECRVSISKKGSLLYYSKIELKWNATAPFAPRQDTFLTVVNDYPEPVCVQWYFINGDDPTAAVFAGSPPVRVERSHKGCNQVDCTTELSANKSTYMSALTGGPLGCQPFSILDTGTPPGRPDPENADQRLLRGYAIAFAVDCTSGAEISWNHLSGHVDIVNYANRSAWEYNTFAFQCVADPVEGNLCGSDPGTLHMDGIEFDYAYDKLLFDFYASGSFAFSLIPTAIQVDTDLTLYPVSVDLRTDSTDSDGPVVTRAKFDIWNQNEDARSGVNRCITCWDQTLLSNYEAPNNFLIANLQTNKGKARIDGIESDSCDAPGACCDLKDDPDCDEVDFRRGTPDRDCSQNAALLGVADKILYFSGPRVPAGTRTDAGMTLVGQGFQEAVINRDLVAGPDPLTDGLQIPDAQGSREIDEVMQTPVRAPDRSQRPRRLGKE